MTTSSATTTTHRFTNHNDASRWTYVGEGGKHAVFSSMGYPGKLLRIRKKVLRGEEGKEDEDNEVMRAQQYIQNIVAPYLGKKVVDVPQLVVLERRFVRDLRELTLQNATLIPSFRWKDWQLSKGDPPNEGATITHDNNSKEKEWYAMLVVDYRCPHVVVGKDNSDSTPYSSPSWMIEIKPKAGYLAFSPLVDPRYRHAKYRQSRFQSLQQLCRHGQWNKGWSDVGSSSNERQDNNPTTLSRYDPVDLFSGDLKRIECAVEALFHTPQNNLKICRTDSLQHISTTIPPEKAPSYLQDILQSILIQLPAQTLLQRILAWQELDVLDVDGACLIYQRLLNLIATDAEKKEDMAVINTAQQMIDKIETKDVRNVAGFKKGVDHSDVSVSNCLCGLELSPFLVPQQKKDGVDGESNPLHEFCRKIDEFRQRLEASRRLKEPIATSTINECREEVLSMVEGQLDAKDCVFLLQTWLLSLMMCDLSVVITIEEETETGNNNRALPAEEPVPWIGDKSEENIVTISLQSQTRTFTCSLHVLDCDPKPAEKLHKREEKEKAFGKLS